MLYKEIFVVDDDPWDIEILIETLDLLDGDFVYRIHSNPIKALKELQRTDIIPDLIFLDINMPRMNGFEFIDCLRNNQRLKEIEIVLFSNPDQRIIASQIKDFDKLRYLQKPNTIEALKTSLKKLLFSPGQER